MKKIFLLLLLSIVSSPLFSMHMVRARRARLAAEKRKRSKKANKKPIEIGKKHRTNPAHRYKEQKPETENIDHNPVYPLEQGLESGDDNPIEVIKYPQYDRDQQGRISYEDIPDDDDIPEIAQHEQPRIKKKSKYNRKKKNSQEEKSRT